MTAMTRSRIEEFDRTASLLAQSAAEWRNSSVHWEKASSSYVTQVASPGGTDWRGQAADTAFETADADQRVVLRATGHIHEMAGTAEQGSSYLSGARESALAAIAQAEVEGFDVGEDLSVRDVRAQTAIERAARHPFAVVHASYINHCADRLDAANERIAAELRAGAVEMTKVTPAHWQPGFDAFAQAVGYGIHPPPSGPIVWCLRPGGAAGKFRCSVLFPNGSTDGYWSLTDDSGGSLP